MVAVFLRKPFEAEVFANVTCSRAPVAGECVLVSDVDGRRSCWRVEAVYHAVLPFMPAITAPGVIASVVEADDSWVEPVFPGAGQPQVTYVSTP